jgi:hypothetical protein
MDAAADDGMDAPPFRVVVSTLPLDLSRVVAGVSILSQMA